jgi:hypothetical protein
MPLPVRTLALAAALIAFAPFVFAPSRAEGLAAECEYAPNGPSHLVVGSVECVRFDSAMMGGVVPFTYYVPPACHPALGRKCPMLYLLHGLTGGDQQMMAARGQAENEFVRSPLFGQRCHNAVGTPAPPRSLEAAPLRAAGLPPILPVSERDPARERDREEYQLDHVRPPESARRDDSHPSDPAPPPLGKRAA